MLVWNPVIGKEGINRRGIRMLRMVNDELSSSDSDSSNIVDIHHVVVEVMQNLAVLTHHTGTYLEYFNLNADATMPTKPACLLRSRSLGEGGCPVLRATRATDVVQRMKLFLIASSGAAKWTIEPTLDWALKWKSRWSPPPARKFP